jgi:hypothetical protein
MGKQYDKEHAVTKVATAAFAANRFIGYDGAHATGVGGAHDAQGVSETEAAIGQAASLITEYSAPVEAGEAIAAFAFVKPAADGSGKAVTGTATEHCGRALEAAAGDGDVFECQVLPHQHTPV